MNYTQSNGLPEYITLSEYLFHRLKQLNIETIFGLPGAFNTALIDKLYTVLNLRWAGNTNELNAAYAADGYSRLKGLGCLVTTFGVGELSAVNGIAGSYAEHVGILHVVGMPPTSAQTKQLLLHHTLGNGDYNVYSRMASEITANTRLISDTELCAEHVDQSICTAWIQQKPVYLGIPINLNDTPVESKKLNYALNIQAPTNNPVVENEVIEQILNKIYKAKNPVIISDACVTRHRLIKQTQEFCERTKFPVFATPMSKGSIDESLMSFGGVFMGSISSPDVREVVDFADVLIVIGCLLSDFNTSSFHFAYKTKDNVLIYPTCVKLKNSTYPDLYIESLMKALLFALDESRITYTATHPQRMIVPRSELPNRHSLRQEWIWNQISHWFREGDIIITETGTSSFGINQTKFPHGSSGISQPLWGSVGYSLGACLGASFALQELKLNQLNPFPSRVILFVGDGAFQLTVQELSTIIRWGLTPYIFILNNQGYSVDRFLHHRSNASYYDIQSWDYLRLLPTFGATSYETKKVVTVGDFLQMIHDPGFSKDDKIRLLEIMLPPMDVPQALMDKWLTEQETKKRTGSESDISTPSSQISIKRIKPENLMLADNDI